MRFVQQQQSHGSLTALLTTPPSPPLAKGISESEPGSIAHLSDRDDAEIWYGWKRRLYYVIPPLTLLNIILYVTYLTLRIVCVISAQQERQVTYYQAWVFLAIEIAVTIPPLMHNGWTMWATKRRQRPKLRLLGDDVPSVDVFITCCGEEDGLILDTVRAACDLDYPLDRFRVILLDDGPSQALESAVAHFAKHTPNLLYLSRSKIPGVPHHFKAGNLNYGLEQSLALPGGPSTYMAALDADMVSTQSKSTALLHLPMAYDAYRSRKSAGLEPSYRIS